MKKIIFSIFTLTLMYACTHKASAPQASTGKRSAPKDIVSSYPVENPLTGYLKGAGYKMNGKSSEIAVPSDEMGFSFMPLTDGIITDITVKIPAVRQDLPVTIWDKKSVRKLINEEVNVAVADKLYTFPIKPLRVFKNTEYIISMNTNSYYGEYKAGGASYPVKVGNILVTNFCYNDGVQKKMPIRNDVNHYKGNISFNFQKIDGKN
jgi:hypothetical protein